MMRNSMIARIFFLLVLVAAIRATPASATLVIADYNDLALGAQAGQAGGTGFVTNNWGGTGTIDVISGDLTAPASTGYALTQSGTPLSIIGDHTAGRRNIRTLETALTGDTVWFSFLVQNTKDSSRGGISFNGSGYTPADPLVQTTGSNLYVNGSIAATGVFTTGQTSLVLGRVTVNDTAADAWDIWVDPDLSGGPGGLGTPTSSTVADHLGAAGITRLGNISYHYVSGAVAGDQDGAKLDMIYLSDGPDAFTDVTGVQHDPVLASYQFTGGSAASTDSDLNSTASDFDVSPIGGAISNSTHMTYVGSNLAPSATDDAVTDGDYVGFTVDFGYTPHNLTSLSFDYLVTDAYEDRYYGVRVMNSVTGFDDFGTVMDSDDAVADGVNRTYTIRLPATGDSDTFNVNIDLTDPYTSGIFGDDLQGVTGPVEFRFYLVDNTTDGARMHRIDNVMLQGYSVPEPSTFLMSLLGLLGLAWYGRRRRDR